MRAFSRREIIHRLFFGSALCSFPRAWSKPLAVAVQMTQASTNESGFIRLNLADFPELAQANGSVRISTSAIDPATHKQLGLFPPIIINRGTDQFYVMSAACTHEECIVARLSKTAGRMVCPCHGSEYLIDGTVAHGPAQQSLLRYEFVQQGDLLIIQIPDAFYEITVSRIPESGRLQISFIAFAHITYELYFRESVRSEPQQVSFATSASGPLDQTELRVADDYAHVFVERSGKTGFFEVAMRNSKV
jgi:Rieske Fe-S protein